jgi:microcystin-dependent protein
MKWIRLWAISILICTALPVAAQSPTGTPDYRQMVPVGTVMMWIGNFTPAGWLVADGSCVSQSTYPQLYAVIGSQFSLMRPGTECFPGTFGLPDLRGRVPMGSGSGQLTQLATLTPRTTGNYFGTETVTLTVTEMPAHAHNLVSSAGILLYSFGAGANGRNGLGVTAGTNATATRLTTESNGSGRPFSALPPVMVVNMIINAGTTTLELPPTATVVPTATPQPSSTPAPTATPQPTWTLEAGVITTPRPEIVYYSTMEANGTYQAVAFEYSFTAGDAMVSILLLLTCGLLALGMVMRARGGKA